MQTKSEIGLMDIIPRDVLPQILEHFDLKELAAMLSVSKDWSMAVRAVIDKIHQTQKRSLIEAFNQFDSDKEPEKNPIIKKLINEATKFKYLPVFWDKEQGSPFNKKLASLIVAQLKKYKLN